MKFNLGQIRQTQISTNFLVNDQTHATEDYVLEQDEKKFVDQVFNTNKPFQHGKCYYLRVNIKKQQAPQQLKIYLTNNNALEKQNEQILRIYDIPANTGGPQEKDTIVELVFTPTITYNQIVFSLVRTIDDYHIEGPLDSTYGRPVLVEIEKVIEVYNILEDPAVRQRELTHMGVQSKPGLLMCINGEGIYVGPGGIYEINNGFRVHFLGLIIEDPAQNYFIIDYQY